MTKSVKKRKYQRQQLKHQETVIGLRSTNHRFKNTATKRKEYWENISKRQYRNEIKNKHKINCIKTKRTRRERKDK